VTGKVSYSNGNQNSIRNFTDYGPGFGGGCDLYHYYSDIWCSNKYQNSSYPDIDVIPKRINIESKFNVDDYEVFQVIKE
jgi:hypothetical protein